MTTQKYSVTQHPVETLITWIKSGEIAIPEIQRPFVWEATKVRDLLDSLLKGYPIGYLIAWQNPTVKLKDGTTAPGKRILIDGQQRITAFMAALLGYEVVNKEYKRVHIRIAFHPIEKRFEVPNSIIQKDPTWIPDIVKVFDPNTNLFELVNDYCVRNPSASQQEIFNTLNGLLKIVNNPIGMINLDPQLDIETVTEIFIRVNSAGVPLSQADFAMSKIAVNEQYDGTTLRKAIDYFCHLAVAPGFCQTIQRNDPAFANTDYFARMKWLEQENDDLYDPTYTDMLRVAFTSQFRRGRLQDLVALLSGRNFETKQYEEVIVQDTFSRLSEGVLRFMNQTDFNRLLMIVKSSGYIDSSMISSQNALNVAYMIYLTMRVQGAASAEIERVVRRWFVMSAMTGRYSGSSEASIDFDIRQMDVQGIAAYTQAAIEAQLSESFWNITLPQELETSSINSPYFRAYQAAQVKLGDKGFLSRDIPVRELIEHRSDVHHIFPRDVLKKAGMTRGQYNQVANYVVAQSEINIQIGNKEPAVYFGQLAEQVCGGVRRYGNITHPDTLGENLVMNCIPAGIEHMTVADYPVFLAERRKLMAQKIRTYFEGL
jgi:hypothetical protein